MANQPKWAFVANLGDVNPLDHGGLLVYRDRTGVHPPEAVRIEPRDHDGVPEHELGRSWYVTSFVLEPCTYSNGVLSDNPYHPDQPAWFAKDLPAIARFMGQDGPDGIIADVCSCDPVRRALGYQAVGLYLGFHEFADTEIITGRVEMRRRHPAAFPRRRRSKASKS
jgi:hypothetical protein